MFFDLVNWTLALENVGILNARLGDFASFFWRVRFVVVVIALAGGLVPGILP